MNEFERISRMLYSIEGLNVIMDMGDYGKYVEYTATDEEDLKR